MSSPNGVMKEKEGPEPRGVKRSHSTANAGSEITVMPSGSSSLVSQADPRRR
jgi:hypothetical protein